MAARQHRRHISMNDTGTELAYDRFDSRELYRCSIAMYMLNICL